MDAWNVAARPLAAYRVGHVEATAAAAAAAATLAAERQLWRDSCRRRAARYRRRGDRGARCTH